MAWTAPRTWTDGELVTKAIMDLHVRDNLNAMPDHILARKSADESVVSSTALQNDDHLVFAMGINQVWYLRLILWAIDNSAGVADINLFLTVPASGASTMSGVYFTGAGTLTNISFTEAGAANVGVTPAAGQILVFNGFATTGGTSGNWQLQWAQNTSNGSTVILKKGSFLSGWQIT